MWAETANLGDAEVDHERMFASRTPDQEDVFSSRSDRQRLGDLLNRHPAEEAKFHDLCRARLGLFQFAQCTIQIHG